MQQRLRTAACRVVARASLLARPVAVASWLLPGLVVLAPLPVAAQESLLPALAARYGPQAAQRGEQLVALLQRLRRAPVAQQLDRVNTFFNAFAYRADRALWRKADHWSTPLEFIGRGGGDCEDFAIGKYFALRWLAVAPDALRVDPGDCHSV